MSANDYEELIWSVIHDLWVGSFHAQNSYGAPFHPKNRNDALTLLRVLDGGKSKEFCSKELIDFWSLKSPNYNTLDRSLQ